MVTAPWLPSSTVLTALPVGLAFGVALERAGLGQARTIAAQFTGKDFTVVKVMFSCIATAALLLFWAAQLGWLDMSQVAVSETDLLPQAIGAVLFGAGFAIAALCPGTACVAAATGARDGVAAIIGLFVGTLAIAELWPALGKFAENAPRPDALLPTDLGLPAGGVVAMVVFMAIVTIWLADRVEGIRGTRRPVLVAVALTLAALAAVQGRPTTQSQEVAVHDALDAVVLGEWIKDRKVGLRVVDVRSGVDSTMNRIPRAEAYPLAKLHDLIVASNETVVLYGDSGNDAAAAWSMLHNRGIANLYLLRGGIAAWEDEVFAPLVPANPSDSAAVAAFRRARVLSRYFGGMPRTNAGEAKTTRPRRPRIC